MSIQMELHKIIISEMQDQQIIVLKEVDGERKFPIVIGSGEAMAIDRRLKGIPTPRPLTNDLLASVIEQMGGKIDHIEITNLKTTPSSPPSTLSRTANSSRSTAGPAMPSPSASLP